MSPVELSIPIVVPFLKYYKPMLECEAMKVSAVVVNKLIPDSPYLAEEDVVLLDPPITVRVSRKQKMNIRPGLLFPSSQRGILKNVRVAGDRSG